MAIEIRIASSELELEQICKFRYKVYVEEMGRSQEFADHKRKLIREPLDQKGFIVGAFEDGEVVGTVRSNISSNCDLGHYFSYYDMDCVGRFHPNRTSITTKLIVDSRYRNGPLAIRLAKAVYKIGLENRIEFDFIDCNQHLVNFFERLGYRQYKVEIVHHEYGEVTPLILVMNDLDHLIAINSPLRKINKTLSTELQLGILQFVGPSV